MFFLERCNDFVEVLFGRRDRRRLEGCRTRHRRYQINLFSFCGLTNVLQQEQPCLTTLSWLDGHQTCAAATTHHSVGSHQKKLSLELVGQQWRIPVIARRPVLNLGTGPFYVGLLPLASSRRRHYLQGYAYPFSFRPALTTLFRS